MSEVGGTGGRAAPAERDDRVLVTARWYRRGSLYLAIVFTIMAVVNVTDPTATGPLEPLFNVAFVGLAVAWWWATVRAGVVCDAHGVRSRNRLGDDGEASWDQVRGFSVRGWFRGVVADLVDGSQVRVAPNDDAKRVVARLEDERRRRADGQAHTRPE